MSTRQQGEKADWHPEEEVILSIKLVKRCFVVDIRVMSLNFRTLHPFRKIHSHIHYSDLLVIIHPFFQSTFQSLHITGSTLLYTPLVQLGQSIFCPFSRGLFLHLDCFQCSPNKGCGRSRSTQYGRLSSQLYSCTSQTFSNQYCML